ncbi:MULTISPECIES: type VI secretion system protein TssL, long form [unclassified Arsukibacterium]|uniref:type VI secretion system protein TssL, long form n=1 Tax=unclassified Arsukibacterium TaxID=2635278 RepID=UPI000C3ED1BD|nr:MULTISPECIES: type VI secretion system protein TssL, long form [unclassified Arsukibacterium]MAA93534.1 type VI secretion system protein TssL [Rheinheimera sp.]MBM33502.1 type VI secretion system protein TssL [Rheinheimera sp.]HAW91770.1 type VI secretion system protein TssL [Candidatus Azambacteria bacterium]|tara:strand:- start:27744 stop:29069 length:1326 start_codon:yes stop_codon:yes gene_type:complete
MSDQTIIKPRPGGRAIRPEAAPAAPPEPAVSGSVNNDKTRIATGNRNSVPGQMPPTLSISDNVLVDEAAVLFSLVGPIRSTPSHNDVNGLKKQCVGLINQYEQQLRVKGIVAEVIEQARYTLCCFIDEIVLNTSWGGNSDWATESLLSTFHNETFGGEYFFTLLESAISQPAQNLTLLELQYLCLSFGFVGKMRVEERGYEKLELIKDRAYKAIRSQRGEPARELSPKWHSDAVQSGALENRLPLWVLCSVIAALLLGVYMYLNYQVNSYSNQVHRELNALVNWQPDAVTGKSGKPHQDAVHLQQLLQTEIRRDMLQVIELPDRVRIRVGLHHLFTAGGVTINESFQPVITKIARSLEGVDGRILVTGFTDDLPIFTSKYPSNWHLSLARANAMADALAAGGQLHGRLWPEGRGEADPIATNDTAANRALNRRVEIDLLAQ